VYHYIRKEQDKSMNRDEGSTNFYTSMTTYCPPQQHLVDSRSNEGSSGCQNVNNNNVYKGCNLMNLSTYTVQIILEMAFPGNAHTHNDATQS